jgi:hypothetical protein
MIRLLSRDERESVVDLAADRLAFLVLSYGLLVVVAYRAFALHETAWDLMALLVASGVVAFGYRVRRGVASRDLGLVILAAAIIAAVVASVIGLAVAR